MCLERVNNLCKTYANWGELNIKFMRQKCGGKKTIIKFCHTAKSAQSVSQTRQINIFMRFMRAPLHFNIKSNPTNPMLFLQFKVLIFRSPAANTKVVTMLLAQPSRFVHSFQGLFVNEICWICFRFWHFIVILLLHSSL